MWGPSVATVNAGCLKHEMLKISPTIGRNQDTRSIVVKVQSATLIGGSKNHWSRNDILSREPWDSSPVPTLSVWQGNHSHHDSSSRAAPSRITTTHRPTEPSPTANIVPRRRRRCGTRGAISNVPPRSPPSSGPARCRQKNDAANLHTPLLRTSIRRHGPLPQMSSSLLPSPPTPPGKSPITPRYARGWRSPGAGTPF